MTDSRGANLWLVVFYLLLIVWVPIPLGSNRPWSAAVLQFWVFILCLFWLSGFVRGRNTLTPAFVSARPVLACLAGWLGLVWLQLLPLPLSLLRVLSPESAHWHSAAAMPAIVNWAPITLDRFATLDAACKSTAFVAIFSLTLLLLQDAVRIRAATYVIVLSGVFQALYGVATSFQNLNGWATGTFVNRNHYAGYLVMCLSVGIGVLLGSFSIRAEGTAAWREWIKDAIRWIITPKMALRLLLVTMVVALVLTRSRMGNASFLAGLLLSGMIGLLFSKNATRAMVVLIISLLVIDLLFVGAYFGAQRVIERIGETSMQTEDRDELARYAVRMWSDFPILGSGLGSFPAVFPRYSGEGTAASYTHAHNDYLEFAAEAGLAGLGLLGLAVALSLNAAVRAQQMRRDPVMRGISFASTMAIIALMIHSVAEFNFQIPANALTFMVLLALAWVARYCEAGE